LDGSVQFNAPFAAGVGILIQAASRVEIDNCKIMNFGQKGIVDTRTGGGTQLFIKSTLVRGNTGPGIVAAPPRPIASRSKTFNQSPMHMELRLPPEPRRYQPLGYVRNATAGVEVDPGGQVYVDYTEIANNGTGVQAYGNIALGNSGIVSNSTGISGTTSSYGNNRIFANFSAGTAPTPIPQQ
jgi:hypothetical protein